MLRQVAPLYSRLLPATVRGYAVAGNNLALIKELREQSGAPISDVKAALQQADWNIEQAAQELRKKGIASAGKKAGRVAAEGLVGLAANGQGVAVVEINSETDFVPRNDLFKSLVSNAAAAALSLDVGAGPAAQSVEAASVLSATGPAGGQSIKDELDSVAGTVRENMKLRRAFYLPIPQGGIAGSYIHQSAGEGLGKIAGAVVLAPQTAGAELTGDAASSVAELGRKLSMQVVASAPRFLDKDSVTPEAMQEEEAILREQARGSGKPAKIVDKMIAGRMSKFYQEVCLLEQPFVMDDSKKVKQVVEELGKQISTPLKLVSYLRVKVGEGVDKDESDFAAEVAATLKQTA